MGTLRFPFFYTSKSKFGTTSMRLLQFSTSHYCRKARLALGYKQLSYNVDNLTPGVHTLKIKPLTGTTTLPVLLPELADAPIAVGDSSQILQFLEKHTPQPPLLPAQANLKAEAMMLEDWLDESIGTATRFVYYDFRIKEGKQIDPSFSSMAVIQIVRWQYGMTPARVELARVRLDQALSFLKLGWADRPYLIGDALTVADIAAAALLSPLALIPAYRQSHPWLFERISQVHQQCHEPLPPGLALS
jgi:glutathione S-transferase